MSLLIVAYLHGDFGVYGLTTAFSVSPESQVACLLVVLLFFLPPEHFDASEAGSIVLLVQQLAIVPP